MFSFKQGWPILTAVAIVLGFLLMGQVNTIKQQKAHFAPASEQRLSTAAATKELTDTTLIESGACPVEGPGVVLSIADSDKKQVGTENPNVYIVHDEDMLNIINELRAAGAEAISLNGQRLVATTEIRCAGPTISVNNERSAPPFVIKAIGNPKTIEAALNMRGGIVETLGVWGIKVNIESKNKIVVPAYVKNGSFRYAQPEREGGK